LIATCLILRVCVPIRFIPYNPRVIIKVYGEFWNRSRVDWMARELLGVRKGRRRCDIWNQRGIYALYKDFRIVYVGQADSRAIGARLSEHRTDRFAERWDSFSFFGICEVDGHGKAKSARRVTVPPASVIKSLELMAILLSDAPLNRARGKFPDGAEKVWQLETDRPSRSYQLDQKLSEIASQIEGLQRSLAGKNRKAATKRRVPSSR
jgi:hypothetical protein